MVPRFLAKMTYRLIDNTSIFFEIYLLSTVTPLRRIFFSFGFLFWLSKYFIENILPNTKLFVECLRNEWDKCKICQDIKWLVKDIQFI